MYPYRNIFKLCVSSLTWHPLSRHQLWLFSAEWQSASPLSLPLCRLLHRHPLSLSAATEADRATKILSVRRLRARGCATQEWHREGEIGRKGPERQEEVGVGGNLTNPQKLQQFSKSECWIMRWMWKQNAKKKVENHRAVNTVWNKITLQISVPLKMSILPTVLPQAESGELPPAPVWAWFIDTWPKLNYSMLSRWLA